MAAAPRPPLTRLLQPSSVAVVGASDTAVAARTVASIVDLDIETFLVNPRYPTVFGRPTVPSLASIGRPVDVVFSLLSAARTVRVAEEAADAGAGGLVVIAAGFAEMGTEGADLQRRLAGAAARANMPVVGPNGVGYINVTRGLELTSLPRFGRRAGGVSVVAHSGAMLEAFASCAYRSGGVGLNLMVSAGNEAVTDMADYLDYLAGDQDTRVIVLALEKIRRPAAFFAAARKARLAGKPMIALKLGRTERAQAMARSHTGAITGDSWVYEVAFRQAGIITAAEVDELVDRAQFLEQLPPEKWSAVRGLAVLTGTGGFASLAADLSADEHVDVPAVGRLDKWIGEVVPGAQFANPLDATGFVVTRPEIWEQVIDAYAAAPEFDSFIYLSQFAPWDLRSKRFSDSFTAAAQRSAKPYFVSPLAGPAADWTDEYRSKQGVAVGNGLRGSFRALRAMAEFTRSRPDAAVQSPDDIPSTRRPGDRWVNTEAGPMLTFGAAMALVTSAGIEVAPFQLVPGDTPAADPPFPGPYVVKLADVPHRTEIGAVLTGVGGADLPAAVSLLRAKAREHQVADLVVIQPQLVGHGEAFIGLTGQSELGPLVAFGIGGVLVEVLGKVAGRLAPLTCADARELVAEFDELGVIDGVRGKPGWNRAAVEELLVRAGSLIAAGRNWIAAMDINPLIVTERGLIAVDAACFAAADTAPGSSVAGG
jgi:acyl-CoA synthetase (NDP forming)